MGLFKKSCYGRLSNGEYVSMNPNPCNFQIIEIVEFNNTYVEAIYPDAKNYEGRKVMVYAGKVAKKIKSAKRLDPHFSCVGLSPIARFAPTDDGRFLAMKIAQLES